MGVCAAVTAKKQHLKKSGNDGNRDSRRKQRRIIKALRGAERGWVRSMLRRAADLTGAEAAI